MSTPPAEGGAFETTSWPRYAAVTGRRWMTRYAARSVRLTRPPRWSTSVAMPAGKVAAVEGVGSVRTRSSRASPRGQPSQHVRRRQGCVAHRRPGARPDRGGARHRGLRGAAPARRSVRHPTGPGSRPARSEQPMGSCRTGDEPRPTRRPFPGQHTTARRSGTSGSCPRFRTGCRRLASRLRLPRPRAPEPRRRSRAASRARRARDARA